MAGAPGAPGAAAARPAGTEHLELRRGQGAATTRGLEPVAARTPRPGTVRLSRGAQLMRDGVPGALILLAARRVVEGRRREPDSAATPPGRHLQWMIPDVRDHLLKHQTVTLTLVQ